MVLYILRGTPRLLHHQVIDLQFVEHNFKARRVVIVMVRGYDNINMTRLIVRFNMRNERLARILKTAVYNAYCLVRWINH